MADESMDVSFCRNVTAGEIRKAVQEGARTVEQVQEKTGAGTGCGGCKRKIETYLQEFLPQ